MNQFQSVNTITFQVADSAAAIAAAKHLRHDVYLSMGYIAHPFPNGIIPDDVENTCTYIIARDDAMHVIGTLRLNTGHPYKPLHTWKGKLYEECYPLIRIVFNSRCFEIGALAVKKECSEMKVSWGLYSMAYKWAIANGLPYGIISMDLRALRALQITGWRVIQVGAPIHYFGSLTVPGIIPINEQPSVALTKTRPSFRYVAA